MRGTSESEPFLVDLPKDRILSTKPVANLPLMSSATVSLFTLNIVNVSNSFVISSILTLLPDLLRKLRASDKISSLLSSPIRCTATVVLAVACSNFFVMVLLNDENRLDAMTTLCWERHDDNKITKCVPRSKGTKIQSLLRPSLGYSWPKAKKWPANPKTKLYCTADRWFALNPSRLPRFTGP